MINDKPLGTDVYADFSGFESMRKAARENSPEAVHAVAKKLEGVFLNMMLSSMREANQLFTEDSIFSSKDVRFYQQMLDQQLSVSLSEGKGMGLADEITKQLADIDSRRYDPNKLPQDKEQGIDAVRLSLDRYRVTAVPVAPSENSEQAKASPLDPVVTETSVESRHNQQFIPLSPQDFVNKIAPYAQRSAAALGVPVESIVAQAALETGWGRYLMKHENGDSAFNFFGIKAGAGWEGDRVDVKTMEYRNGVAAEETASFRSYSSLNEAFQDYSDFLSNKPRYQQALAAFAEQNDAKAWGHHLQQAGYATDPNYGKKIAAIVSRLQKDGAFNIEFANANKVKNQ
ncbi:MAG: flagellar assembly peptidoglycan hydrolase FlgJ [Pseudomonadales bacterium]|nr:flagellar assembly peptidoglycan hydrolase FlgJ [Pseudomonadales bacterium]